MPKISPFLWFHDNAEEASKFYVKTFKNSKILGMSYYGKEGEEVSGMKPGSVMTVSFLLDGQEFTAINGGSAFTINEAISFVIHCENQNEVDYYWNELSAGGDEKAQQCGWLKDKYGVSWQVIPNALTTLLASADAEKSSRVMKALLSMKKLDIEALQDAFDGK